MKKTDKFIESYNEFEILLRKEKEMPPLEYEEHLPPEDMNKLKICRICRNYIQHNGKDFVIPTEAMVSFIKSLASKIESEITSVKDNMSRVKPLTPKDNITDAAKRLERLPFVPVVENDVCIGVITDETIRKACAKNTKKIKDMSLSSIKYTKRDIFLKDAPVPSVVTDTGKQNGKYLGVLK